MSSKFQVLRKEINYLKDLFPKDHNVLRILTASLDDIELSYNGLNNKSHCISCSITVCIVLFKSCQFL